MLSLIECLFFFFLHFNSSFKCLIDICTIDFLHLYRRFFNIYNVLSIIFNCRFIFNVLISRVNVITSVRSIYSNADWYERES